MKIHRLLRGLSFAMLCSVANAQTIRTLQHVGMKLPSQFIVTPDGVSYVRTGVATPSLVPWEKINLQDLAREEPQIEEARKTALLEKKSIWFTVPPPVNYYREFLAMKVSAKFESDIRVTTTTTMASFYEVSMTGFSDPTTGTSLSSGSIDGMAASTSQTHAVDATISPLETTVEGLFMLLGNDYDKSSEKISVQLQHKPGFYQNISIGLRSLQAIYPQDTEIKNAISAIDLLSTEDKVVSVDARRELARFVEHARSMAQGGK